jgi:TRAP-type C4-dicarboxylate transport system permease small subunit
MTNSHSRGLHLLGQLSKISASLGGLILVALALMTLASVIGRAFFSSPIQGDIELVQLGCAVCVACFLPYTQYQRANIIVDFFTDKCSDKTKQFLDGFGALLIGLCFSLLAWRIAVGGMIIKENGETSMLMSIPVWIPYLFMVPGFVLTALVSFAQSIELLFSNPMESV